MNRREGPGRRTTAGLIPVIVIVVLVVLALVLLFVWSPWDRTDSNGAGGTIPDGPGPESELTPVTSSQMIDPAQHHTAWVTSSPGVKVGYLL